LGPDFFFEENKVFGRRSSRFVTLLRKTAGVVPHALTTSFFNFASAFPSRARCALAPVPHPPQPLPRLVVGEAEPNPGGFVVAWERAERGLPLDDDTVAEVGLDGALCRVPDVVLLMAELHRVCIPGARVRAALPPTARQLAGADPRAVRIVTPTTLACFAETAVERPLAFEVESSAETPDGSAVILRVCKQRVSGFHASRIDLGCGSLPRAGYLGIDRFAGPAVGIVRDIECHGLPFGDDTISHVNACHFLEHMGDVVFVMNEIHRVCCHDARVDIVVPTMLGPWAAADPTHRHLFNARTFQYFERGGLQWRRSPKSAAIRSRFARSVHMRQVLETPSATARRSRPGQARFAWRLRRPWTGPMGCDFRHLRLEREPLSRLA
jgi:SAM-dependent methyltransferase